MTNIELDMIQTAGIGALALIVGMILTRKVAFLQKFCVPSPVSGGIIFSLITLALYGWFDIEVSFDGTLKDVFMLAFFTSVGFQSDLKVLKQGGKLLVIMLVLLVVIIALQNLMWYGRRICKCARRDGTRRCRHHRYGCCYLRPDCRFHDWRPVGRADYPHETDA